MKAPVNEQLSLLDVQGFDIQIATLNNRAAALPEIAEISSVTNKYNNARDLRIAAETELNDVGRELSRAEGDVEQIVTRIERDEKRLASGTGTPKELEQTQHELETLGLRRKELEEVELEIMMRIDVIKERISGHRAEEEEFTAQINDLNIRKENALAAIHTELEKITAERAATIPSISTELVALYEKIRADGGIAAAVLAGNQCKGCNLPLNASDVQRINAMPDDEVARCEECRCILVRSK
jgi:predicted  nucleic acid-binding Zn-ribbon protein